MKRRICSTAAVLCAAAMLLSGCAGFDGFITGETYPDAAKYQTGAFSYDADGINAVEVYWRCGEVEIVQSDKAALSVSESGTKLSDDAAMHSLSENGVLHVRFCASGAKVRVQAADKRLRLEVPKGVALSVHTTSARLTATALEQKSVFVSTHSGSTVLETVTADTVELSSNSGIIYAEGVTAATLKCHASSGTVRIGDIAAQTVNVTTRSGSVALSFDEVQEAAVSTSSGRVTATLPKGGAEVLYTTGSGRLHTARTYTERGDLCVFGGGTTTLTVETSSGDLEIR